jgi:D-alanyl-D-alanine carboxypeptidase
MVPSRPVRTAARRAVVLAAALTLVVVGTLALGPALSAGLPAPDASVDAPTGPDGPRPTSAASRDGPDLARRPTNAPSTPPVSVIQRRPLAPHGLSASPAARAALDARLRRLREKYAIPGVSVTIIYPDGTRYVGLAGEAVLDEDEPVRIDTAFAIASVSKTFTAALTLDLVEDGLLELDAAVVGYLPALEIDPKITVRQLLDHTSGLHDYFFHPRIDKALLTEPDRPWSPGQALRYMGKPYFEPGRDWHYSNTNYLLLGLIAERVGSAPLAEQLRTRFFEPLGLRRTWYQPTEAARATLAHGYRFQAQTDGGETAVDLTRNGEIAPFTSVVTAAAGAGGLAASSTDVARWARALYGGRVLEDASLQEMIDDMARTEAYGPSVPYGLGVQRLELDGSSTLGHSGRLLGFRSVVRYVEDSGLTIAVLTNQSRADPGVIARHLVRIARQFSTDPREPIAR